MKIRILALLALLNACAFPGSTLGQRPKDIKDESVKGNSPPLVQYLRATPTSLSGNASVSLQVQAYDGEGDNLTYRWTSTRGTLENTSGTSIRWSPLKNGQIDPGISILTVEISDGSNQIAASANVLVKADGSGQVEVVPEPIQICRSSSSTRTADSLVRDDRQPPIKVDASSLPQVVPVIDGEPGDWEGIPPVLTDIARDTGNADSSGDLRALYLARDSRHLYYRIDTWGPPQSADHYRIIAGWSGNITKDARSEPKEEKAATVVEGKFPIVEIPSLDGLYLSAVHINGGQLADRSHLIRLQTTLTPVSQTSTTTAKVLFDNGNIDAVFNGATCSPSFTLAVPTRITQIQNYHWNDAQGDPGGTIQLTLAASAADAGKFNADGQIFGPWPVTTKPGQGNVPNAYWIVSPDVVVPPGTYNVGDSKPATWSQNSGSKSCGITQIMGIPETNP